MSRDARAHLTVDELIDLGANLSGPDESEEARAHLRVCGECEEGFRRVVRDLETFRARQSAMERRAAVFAHRGAPRSRRGILAIGAGGVLAAVTLLGIVLFAHRGSRVAGADGLDYWLPDEHANAEWRSSNSVSNADVAEAAVEAYRKKDTARVVALLHDWPFPPSSFPEAGEPFEDLRLVLASALVWEGDFAEACRQLDLLHAATLPLPYRDRAAWIRYTALRRAGDEAQSRRIAESLASRPCEFSERAASELRSARTPPK